ncbi:MAG: arsenate reductase ArsC [Armatimonadota bacterium]
MKQVLFVCVHNSGRSQMAEALFNRLAPEGMRAVSAGTCPGGGLNPAAVEAMKEIGIDLEADGHHPKVMTPEMVESSVRIITMGCDVDASACPANYYVTEDWGLEDPRNKPLETVRRIRDQIEERVRRLIEEMKDG